MTAVLGIGTNCFVPDRLPIRLGLDGPVIGYADGFKEANGRVTATIHLNDTLPVNFFDSRHMQIVGRSHCMEGEPEVMDTLAILNSRELVHADLLDLRAKRRQAARKLSAPEPPPVD